MTRLLFTLALLLAGRCPAATLEQISRIDLAKLSLPRSPAWVNAKPFRPWGVAFSPDETLIAIGLGWPSAREGGGVLVLPTADPSRVAAQFPITGAGFYGNLAWAPDGRSVGVSFFELSGNRAIITRLQDGDRCENSGEFVGFLDSEHWLIRSDGARDSGRMTVVNSGCRPERRWDLGAVRDVAISHERNRFAILSIAAARPDSVVLYDSNTKAEIRRWPIPVAADSATQLLFANRGGLVCVALPRGREDRRLTCWDSDSGAKVSETDFPCLSTVQLQGRPGRSFSAGNSRIMMDASQQDSIVEYRPILGFSRDPYQSPKRRLIWDAATAQELVSWQPELDRRYRGGPKFPPPFAVSSTGSYLADSGAHHVTIYRVRP